jgi:Glyoxalase-like domain
VLRSDINRIAAGRPRGFPARQQIVLDSTDARRLAEFYRALLGYRYRAGDEPPPAGADDPEGKDWLVLVHPSGRSTSR